MSSASLPATLTDNQRYDNIKIELLRENPKIVKDILNLTPKEITTYFKGKKIKHNNEDINVNDQIGDGLNKQYISMFRDITHDYKQNNKNYKQLVDAQLQIYNDENLKKTEIETENKKKALDIMMGKGSSSSQKHLSEKETLDARDKLLGRTIIKLEQDLKDKNQSVEDTYEEKLNNFGEKVYVLKTNPQYGISEKDYNIILKNEKSNLDFIERNRGSALAGGSVFEVTGNLWAAVGANVASNVFLEQNMKSTIPDKYQIRPFASFGDLKFTEHLDTIFDEKFIGDILKKSGPKDEEEEKEDFEDDENVRAFENKLKVDYQNDDLSKFPEAMKKLEDFKKTYYGSGQNEELYSKNKKNLEELIPDYEKYGKTDEEMKDFFKSMKDKYHLEGDELMKNQDAQKEFKEFFRGQHDSGVNEEEKNTEPAPGPNIPNNLFQIEEERQEEKKKKADELEADRLSNKVKPEYKYQNAIHPDALQLYFQSAVIPKWNWTLFNSRSLMKSDNKEQIKKYLFMQSKCLVEKYGCQLFVYSLVYGESSSLTEIYKENHEIIQLFFAYKHINSGNVSLKLSDLLNQQSLLGSSYNSYTAPKLAESKKEKEDKKKKKDNKKIVYNINRTAEENLEDNPIANNVNFMENNFVVPKNVSFKMNSKLYKNSYLPKGISSACAIQGNSDDQDSKPRVLHTKNKITHKVSHR